jgi:hypothetical protein
MVAGETSYPLRPKALQSLSGNFRRPLGQPRNSSNARARVKGGCASPAPPRQRSEREWSGAGSGVAEADEATLARLD